MTRYYRIALTSALLAGLAMPAFAQTLPPQAPAAAAAPTEMAPAAPDNAPAAAPATSAEKPAAVTHTKAHARRLHAHKAKTTRAKQPVDPVHGDKK